MASKLLSTDQQNFVRSGIICVDLIKLVLKDILRIQIQPKDLYTAIKSCAELTTGRYQLRPEQKKLCFLPPPFIPDYDKFDVSLLYTLIRNLCPSYKPTQGWGKTPATTDIQIGDDIERLRIFRNGMFAHLKYTAVPDTEFTLQWKDLETIIQRIQAFVISKGYSAKYVKELANTAEYDFGFEDMQKYKILLEGMMHILKQTENAESGTVVNLQVEGDTKLIAACQAGNLSIVKELIEAGAYVNLLSESKTPLTAACQGGHMSVVKELLEAGADPNLLSESETPLTAACQAENLSIVKELLEAGGRVNLLSESETPLTAACQAGNLSIVKELLEAGANVNPRCKSETPLTAACQGGHMTVVKELLEAGADVNPQGKSETPLTAACRGGHMSLVKELLEARADINLKVGDDTPMEAALKGGHMGVVKMLVEAGANVNNEGKLEEMETENRNKVPIARNVKNTAIILDKFEKWFYDEYTETNLLHFYYGMADIAKENVKEGDEVIVAIIDNEKFMEKEMPFRYRGENVPVIWKSWKENSEEATLGMKEEQDLEEQNIEELKSIEKYLKRHTEDLFKKHSNLEMILASTYRLEKGKIDETPCIVLYCSCKGIVPINEPLFATTMDGIKTDVREGFFHLHSNFNNDFHAVSTDLLDPLRMGASIGKEAGNIEGTLGGFVNFNGENVGFITCAHNFYGPEEMEMIQHQTEPPLWVVQPSPRRDASQVCGETVRSVSPSTIRNTENISVDATLVRLTLRSPQTSMFADLLTARLIRYGFTRTTFPRFTNGTACDLRDFEVRRRHMSKTYLKCGTTTGLTTGMLKLNSFSGVLRDSRPRRGQRTLPNEFYKNQLVIKGENFSQGGDSGSLVFQVRIDDPSRLDCIGMLVGATPGNKRVVTPIISVLEALNVSLIPFP